MQRTSLIGALAIVGSIICAPMATLAQTAIAPKVSTAAETSHVFKTTSSSLYGLYVTAGTVPGYLLVFDASTLPSDGAVTPNQCVVVPANSTASVTYGGNPPAAYANGIIAAFSTTGCFMKTTSGSALAFFNAEVQ